LGREDSLRDLEKVNNWELMGTLEITTIISMVEKL
jgi:hypothetical protein